MHKTLVSIILVAFLANTLVPPACAQAVMSRPGDRVSLSPAFQPAVLTGVKVFADDPFRLDFILDRGDEQGSDTSARLIKYFLAALTVPRKDLWVNLSPYEKDRIVPEAFGQTEMGRDLLSQDYILKQITASVIYPDGETGRIFWAKVYKEAQEKYGTTDIPVDTFNKVWVVPAQAEVFESKDAAFVVGSRLKVMLESDYLATAESGASTDEAREDIAKHVLRDVVIPVLEKEVNEGKNFAVLRQVYNSLILATWYKRKIKESFLSRVYVDQRKVDGVRIADPQEAEKIWAQYVEAFKVGVFNFIKEERDAPGGDLIPRKYFAGGMNIDPEESLALSTEKAVLPSGNDNRDVIKIKVEMAGMLPEQWQAAYAKDKEEAFAIGTEVADTHSLEYGIRKENSRDLAPQARVLLEYLLGTVKGNARVIELGPGSGYASGKMYQVIQKAKDRGRQGDVRIDVTGKLVLAPHFLLKKTPEEMFEMALEYERQHPGEKIDGTARARSFSVPLSLAFSLQSKGKENAVFDVLQEPFIDRQYVGHFLQVKIPEKYLFIYDSYGAFYYSFRNGLGSPVKKILSMLDDNGLFFLSHIDPQKVEALAEVTDDLVVISTGSSAVLMKRTSDHYRKIAPLLNRSVKWRDNAYAHLHFDDLYKALDPAEEQDQASFSENVLSLWQTGDFEAEGFKDKISALERAGYTFWFSPEARSFPKASVAFALAENFHQHAQGKGLLVRYVAKDAGKVFYAALDHGPGFPVDDHGKAQVIIDQWGDFQQRPGSEGFGLGLGTVNERSEDFWVYTQGQVMDVKSRQSAEAGLSAKGSAFIVTVPLNDLEASLDKAQSIEQFSENVRSLWQAGDFESEAFKGRVKELESLGYKVWFSPKYTPFKGTVAFYFVENFYQHAQGKGVLISYVAKDTGKVFYAAMDHGPGFPVDANGQVQLSLDEWGNIRQAVGSAGQGLGMSFVNEQAFDLWVYTQGQVMDVKSGEMEPDLFVKGTAFIATVPLTEIDVNLQPPDQAVAVPEALTLDNAMNTFPDRFTINYLDGQRNFEFETSIIGLDIVQQWRKDVEDEGVPLVSIVKSRPIAEEEHPFVVLLRDKDTGKPQGIAWYQFVRYGFEDRLVPQLFGLQIKKGSGKEITTFLIAKVLSDMISRGARAKGGLFVVHPLPEYRDSFINSLGAQVDHRTVMYHEAQEDQLAAAFYWVDIQDARDYIKKAQKTFDDSQAPGMKGGIDLDPVDDVLRIDQGREAIEFNIAPAIFDKYKAALGLVPVILNVQPMDDLKGFLGVKN